MLHQLLIAWKGSLGWKILRLKYGIRPRDVVFFLIERDKEWNTYAIRYAQEYLHKKYGTGMVFISPYADVLGRIPEPFMPYRKIRISQGLCESIQKYYQLVKFSDFVCFVSMASPESNWLGRLLGKHGIDKEDLVCLGIYGMRKKQAACSVKENDL